MSEQLPVLVADAPAPHPIHLVVTDDLQRSRLTVFFRLLLVIPHLIWLALWGIAVWFAVLAAWFVGIFTGRVPDGLHGFIAVVPALPDPRLRVLLDRGGPVSRRSPAPPATRSTSRSRRPTKQSRLTIFFRLLLVIPAFIVLYVLGYVAYVVMFLAWFYALFAGKLHVGLRDVLAYWLRYNAQTIGYVCLLTQRYPSFSDE